MTGKGCAHGQVGGLLVADLADQQHIRILAQEAPDTASESNARLLVHTHLLDQGHGVFHRVLNREDVFLHGVDGAHNGVKRRGLTRTCRPGHQHDSVW